MSADESPTGISERLLRGTAALRVAAFLEFSVLTVLLFWLCSSQAGRDVWLWIFACFAFLLMDRCVEALVRRPIRARREVDRMRAPPAGS